MALPPNDRPLATVREETIDTLVANYGRGAISLDAFERRLDAALAAETGDALVELTKDLQAPADVAELRQQPARPSWRTTSQSPANGPGQRFINIFGGSKRRGAWTVAPEVLVVCVFGGTELDFSAATFSAPVTRVRLWCVFGGAQFAVNEHTNVVNNVACVFGGADDRAAANTRADAPTLVFDGLALFGGMGIRVRRALKQRWLEFAQQLKSAFSA